MPVHPFDPWSGEYKIPWHDADFSRRMLTWHLAQDHDLASRRVEWIDRQVEWIDALLADRRGASILDLGCGPGLYAHRLAARGHRVRGIDIGPASIEHARAQIGDGGHCEFVLGDIREVGYGGPHDLVMLLYGEFNVFAPAEAAAILRRSKEALAAGGVLVLETQDADAIEKIGRREPSMASSDGGLFDDRPHRLLTESVWLGDHRVAVEVFTVTDTADGNTFVYRSTTRAWSHEELGALVRDAGFDHAARDSTWPCNTDALRLWIARAQPTESRPRGRAPGVP
jgi:SAM-dependent methyltransferase